jgi:hypothetical protein
MTERFELGAQLAVVVDFSVEDDPDGAALVVDWLASAGEVDDAQTPHAEADARLHVDPFIVWTAVPDHLAHPVHEIELVLLARRLAVRAADRSVRESRYSTHKRSSSMHG